MASYNGPLTEQILIKVDPSIKAALAARATAEQTNLSAEARKALRLGLTVLQAQQNSPEVYHA